jgi:hypothetical protein
MVLLCDWNAHHVNRSGRISSMIANVLANLFDRFTDFAAYLQLLTKQ